MLFQLQIKALQSLSSLHGKIVLDLTERGIAANKHTQLVLDRIGLDLHLLNRPAINIPAEIDHTVLFQKVIIKLIPGNDRRIMARLIIYFNCYLSISAFKKEVCKTVVLIYIIEMILRIQVACLFGTESIRKQLYEQIFCTAARCRPVFTHYHLPFQEIFSYQTHHAFELSPCGHLQVRIPTSLLLLR